MDASSLIERARTALNKQTQYKSPGTTPPLAAASWPDEGAKIDCSGFLAWCLRLPRTVDHPKYKSINGGWFETTAIHADVKASWGYFEALSTPKPGAILVYPDKDGHDGHIGLVTRTNGKPGLEGVDAIIHCSLGGWKKFGDAIRETDASIWKARADSVIGWYSGLD